MERIADNIELLAPVGRWSALEAVLESGADAVYLAGKEYNMRRHRSDFNFTRGELARAAEKVHAFDAKIYVTVNSLLSDRELDEMEGYLRFLESIAVDAIIVQDLGLIQHVRSLRLSLPLHASTMMNIHNPEAAKACAELGLERIICSRDITLHQLKEMQQESGLEMEYFVHGDMCIAQSGQCYSSGILFGSSSNRGKCMKPCRWPYELVDMKTGTPLEVKMEGPYLLAAKDMCLLQFIPELIDAGVASFKIEGRMRPPEFLAQVVRIYRTALDQYLKDPIGYVNDPDLFEELYQQRVRDFSTCFTFKKPDSGLIASSGKREPFFLSTGVKEQEVDLLNPVKGLLIENSIADVNDPPVLAVHVGGPDAAEEALAHGADWIYIGGEVSPVRRQQWPLTDMLRIIRKAHALDKKVGVLLPRVTLSSQIKEIAWFLEQTETVKPDAILVHNLGSLRVARSLSDIPVYADFSFNSLNRRSIELLKGLGAARVTLSLESSFQVVTALAKDAGLPLECMVHGPVTGMYLEHCIMSLALKGTSSQDPCRGACRYLQSGLKNKLGDVYPVEPDQYCRNHILLSKDLACINYLDFYQKAGVQSLRIEAQYYEKELVGLLTELYTGAIKNNHSDNSYRELLRRVLAQSPRGFSLGAYPKGIFKTAGRIVKGHMSAA